LAIGGYNENSRFAEDIHFLWYLKKLDRSRKQKVSQGTSVKTIASTRKLEDFGGWHYIDMIFRFSFWAYFSSDLTGSQILAGMAISIKAVGEK